MKRLFPIAIFFILILLNACGTDADSNQTKPLSENGDAENMAVLTKSETENAAPAPSAAQEERPPTPAKKPEKASPTPSSSEPATTTPSNSTSSNGKVVVNTEDKTTAEPEAPSVPVENKKVDEAPMSTAEADKENAFSVEAPEKPEASISVSHQTWDELVRRHVSATGKVDYAGIKANREKLQQYLDHLADNPVQNDWSRQEKMAYWINAYNAFTVKLIVDNYPVSSIRDLYGGNPWDVKWIELGDKTYSLNNIEHDILRPQFNDPRIHFAVNCAAASCPPILNRAFTADKLDRQLDERTRTFINNAAYNKLSPDKVEVSKIFEWYKEDFGNLIDYLNQYADTDIRKNAEIAFLDYDWKLNDQ